MCGSGDLSCKIQLPFRIFAFIGATWCNMWRPCEFWLLALPLWRVIANGLPDRYLLRHEVWPWHNDATSQGSARSRLFMPLPMTGFDLRSHKVRTFIYHFELFSIMIIDYVLSTLSDVLWTPYPHAMRKTLICTSGPRNVVCGWVKKKSEGCS